MHRSPGSFARLWVVAALAVLVPFSAAAAAAEETPALPSDAEVLKFIAVWKAVAADPDSAREACASAEESEDESADGEESEDESAAAMGRKLEAHPTVGPILARNSISGRRFAEVSMHVFAGMLGLAIADQSDAAERERGKTGTSREAVLRDSPVARLVAAHQAELDPVMQRARELCSSDSVEEEDDSEY
jgi:hypothetical protein